MFRLSPADQASSHGAPSTPHASLWASSVTPAAALVGVGHLAPAHAVPELRDLGLLPGGTFACAAAMNPEGTVVVGQADMETDGQRSLRAFRWTARRGMEPIAVPHEADSRFASATGVSADGRTVVGFVRTPSGERAFYWTQGNGGVILGALEGDDRSRAVSVSACGRVVTGWSMGPCRLRAFRWTPSMVEGGEPVLEALGALPGRDWAEGVAVSGDGRVVAGSSGFTLGMDTGDASAFVCGTAMAELPAPEGGHRCEIAALSHDGRAAAGRVIYAEEAGGVRRAVLWRGGEAPIDLGVPRGAIGSEACGVSQDGGTVVGRAYFPSGPGHAIVWTAQAGVADLHPYLVGRGVDLAGWTLTDSVGVHTPARGGHGPVVMCGTGLYRGQTRAWVAVLPSPTAPPKSGRAEAHTLTAVDLWGGALAARRRR